MDERHPPATTRFRRSAHLVAHWTSNGLRIRNYATGRLAFVSDPEAAVLRFFTDWQTVAEAEGAFRNLTADRVRTITRRLLRHGLLLRDDQDPDPAEARMDAFGPWNPVAGTFHMATRDVTFLPLDKARAAQRQKAARTPWPGARYTPAGAVPMRLPGPSTRSAVARAFLERRSWRRFGPGPVHLEHIATLLWLTAGIQYWVSSDVGEFALKTSPSGGSLHPIELYLLARNVAGLHPGMYHYSAADHGVSLLQRHDTVIPMQHYLPEQPWFEGAAAAVFFVAHYERALWRYTYARAYRAPFVEAGHLAQTFCVQATHLDLAPFVSMALADSAIEQAVGADGVSRAVLYAAGVGERPAGVGWAPSPEGWPDAVRRRNRLPRAGRR